MATKHDCFLRDLSSLKTDLDIVMGLAPVPADVSMRDVEGTARLNARSVYKYLFENGGLRDGPF